MLEFLNGKKKENMTIDEEVKFNIDKIFKKAKINEVKQYLQNNININLFPKENNQIKQSENDDDGSESTKYTVIDKSDSLKKLDEEIKKFRGKNKNVKEKGKKIRINPLCCSLDKENEEIDADDEESLSDSLNF